MYKMTVSDEMNNTSVNMHISVLYMAVTYIYIYIMYMCLHYKQCIRPCIVCALFYKFYTKIIILKVRYFFLGQSATCYSLDLLSQELYNVCPDLGKYVQSKYATFAWFHETELRGIHAFKHHSSNLLKSSIICNWRHICMP